MVSGRWVGLTGTQDDDKSKQVDRRGGGAKFKGAGRNKYLSTRRAQRT